MALPDGCAVYLAGDTSCHFLYISSHALEKLLCRYLVSSWISLRVVKKPFLYAPPQHNHSLFSIISTHTDLNNSGNSLSVCCVQGDNNIGSDLGSIFKLSFLIQGFLVLWLKSVTRVLLEPTSPILTQKCCFLYIKEHKGCFLRHFLQHLLSATRNAFSFFI